MKVLKKYEILNSEGPIMILNKHSDHWSVTVHGSRVHAVVNPYEMLSFLTADGLIEIDSKTYRFNDYSVNEKLDFESYIDLVQTLWKEHKSLREKDKDYDAKYHN